ncbi:MAG: hypothetical protein CSA66_03215 [Proteobacteria bacterium]|nr:MAG: hypothetical protein CSA66_03215 [Pseudomonadota bacterium]
MKNAALEALIEEAQAKRDVYAKVDVTSLDWTADGHVLIAFDDGHEAELTPEFLRAICPCAECRGTHGTPPKAFNILSSGKLDKAAEQTTIKKVEPVGSYAFAITWGDGHKDGIYTWIYLRGVTDRTPKP